MPESLALNEGLIKDFGKDLSLIDNKASNSVRNYQAVLRRFLGERHESTLDAQSLREHFRVLSRKNSRSTQMLAVSAFRSFLRWARRRALIKTRELEHCLQAPKLEKKLIKVFEEDDLPLLINHLKERPIEEQLVFELLYGSGLRISELCDLGWEQLDLDQARVRVIGKGKRMRELPITTGAKSRLETLRSTAASDSRVFLMNERAIREVVAAWGRECGLEDKYGRLHPHKLRHSIATHLVRRGASLASLQKMLGHSRLSTTERYTHLDIRDLARTYDKCFPQLPHSSIERKKK